MNVREFVLIYRWIFVVLVFILNFCSDCDKWCEIKIINVSDDNLLQSLPPKYLFYYCSYLVTIRDNNSWNGSSLIFIGV